MRTRLREEKVLWCASLTRIAAPPIVELYGFLGLDCVWIDMEHSDFDFHALSGLTCAARATGIAPLVRIERNDPKLVLKALECGAEGIVVPDVRTPEQARQAAQSVRFYPEGTRGLSGSDVPSRYGLTALRDYMQEANQRTAVMVQIEHPEAVDCVDEIAAVDGIDLLFVGKMDLSQSLGIPGETRHRSVEQATEKIAAACRRSKKNLSLGAGSREEAEAAIRLGARLVVIASEMGLLKARLQQLLTDFRPISQHPGGS